MTGYGDGRFGASVNLTRAEAVSLLCRAIGETSGVAGSRYNVYFNDVPANAWYAESVNYAASRGYLSVLSQTGYSFNPNTPITSYASSRVWMFQVQEPFMALVMFIVVIGCINTLAML